MQPGNRRLLHKSWRTYPLIYSKFFRKDIPLGKGIQKGDVPKSYTRDGLSAPEACQPPACKNIAKEEAF